MAAHHFWNRNSWKNFLTPKKKLIDLQHVGYGVVGTSTQQTHHT